MTAPDLLLEMIIVGLIGLASITTGIIAYVKHLVDKDYENIRWFLLASIIFVGIMTTIFEGIWLCIYLGLPI